jgi:hypothetical protein
MYVCKLDDPRVRRVTPKGGPAKEKMMFNLGPPGTSARLMVSAFVPQVASDSAWIHDIVNRETKTFFNSVRDSKTQRGEVRRATEEQAFRVEGIK